MVRLIVFIFCCVTLAGYDAETEDLIQYPRCTGDRVLSKGWGTVACV